MMQGRVGGFQAELPVSIVLPDRPHLTISFVIDTGFIGDLALPEQAVAALGLAWLRDIKASLADDSMIVVDEYSATILWHGEELSVTVLATGARPLLGTTLLAGSSMLAEFVETGQVSIERLVDQRSLV